MKRQVFYSFHYAEDVFRVQQIRNIGALEGNAPASANEWEEVKRGGETAIKRWIDSTMSYRSCVIVLIGAKTANRNWINYEICKAWNDKKGLFGIYIHNLKDPRSDVCHQGENPFQYIKFQNGTPLSQYIKVYNPNPWDAYNDISANIGQWIESAIRGAAAR